jgi:hypothetical protein
MKVAAMIAEVMTPLMLAPSACGMMMAPGVGGAGHLLDDLGGGRYATDAGNSDDRVELAAAPEVQDVTPEQSAEGRDRQRQHAQQQQLQDRRVEQRVGFAENAQRQAEEEGGPIEETSPSSLAKFSMPLSRTATPRNSEKNSGAATGKSRHSSVQATTAKISFCERLIFGPDRRPC